MAPPGLLGRYKLYKTGTNKLVQWLAHSASRCCDVASIIKSAGSGSIGKAPHAHTEPMAVRLRTQELIKLAQAIASSDPPVEISDTILDITKNVIAGREECAGWYASQTLQGGGSLEKENETHRYFIMVLQRILKLLTEARASRPKSKDTKTSKPKTKQQATKGSHQGDLTNLFACLEIEECSTSPLGGTPSFAGTQSPRNPLVHYSLENEENDSAFAVWCFLQDLHDVRKSVLDTWQEYCDGSVSFLVASSTTDTAFGLLHSADEDFAKISPVQSSEWTALSHYLGLGFYTLGDAVWMCPDTRGTPPKSLDTKINPVELLCPLGLLCIIQYRDDARSICNPSSSDETADGTDKHGENPQVGEPDEFQQTETHFHEALKLLGPELHSLAHRTNINCAHCDILDEFARGLIDVHRKNSASMWIVVACQIYLDIYDLLGLHTNHGAMVLQQAYSQQRQTAADLDEYIVDVMDRLDDPHDFIGYMMGTAKWARGYESCVSSPHLSNKAKQRMITSKHQLDNVESSASSTMMERHLPAHAGAILANFKVTTHFAGCHMTNLGGFVLSAAHLYKALQSKGLIDIDWHDMDFVLASFGTKQPLVAKATDVTDTSAAVRHYLMALGVPATHFARNKRVGTHDTFNKTQARQLTVTSPFIQGMNVRRCNNKQSSLQVSKYKTIEVALQIMASNAAKSVAGKPRGSDGSNVRNSFTPLQLLSTFKNLLLADEAHLNFNYISFTMSCIRLVQSITDGAASELGLEALRRLCADSQVVSKLIEGAPSDLAVRNAAKLMQDHITSKGKNFVKDAWDQSSGRIPKHLRPVIEPLATNEDFREMACTIFDYADVKYAFSGGLMAAYHQGVQPECGNADCLKHNQNSKMMPGGLPRVQLYRSKIPDSILEQSLANIDKDRERYLAARDGMLTATFADYAEGDCSEYEGDLRGFVVNWTGLELAKLDDTPEERTPWAYIILRDHERYATVLEDCVQMGLASEGGDYLVWPVDFGSARVAAVRQDGLRYLH